MLGTAVSALAGQSDKRAGYYRFVQKVCHFLPGQTVKSIGQDAPHQEQRGALQSAG